MIPKFIKESQYCVRCCKPLYKKGLFSKSEVNGRYDLPESSGLKGTFFCCRNCKPILEKQYGEELFLAEEERHIIKVNLIKESSQCRLCGNKFGSFHIRYTAPPSLHLKEDQYICEVCHAQYEDEYRLHINRAKDRLSKAIADF